MNCNSFNTKNEIYLYRTINSFDISVIAYLHSSKALKKLKKENIYHMDAHNILNMFGGRDRIEILPQHFEITKK